ncbi:MAG: hypothetical protein LBQ66_07320 [Planctomycetaceae bacterium]|nr:hypothetical protein [Planctomycetaceae bacterium]
MSVEIPIHFSHHWGRGQASPLQHWAFWFCRCVNHSRCRRAIMIHWRRNRPAVGCPPYDHQRKKTCAA